MSERAGSRADADRPLAGKTVVVTRPHEQAAALAEPLAALGADVLLVPTIKIVPRPFDAEVAAAVREIGRYGLVVFTSVNGVRVFSDYLDAAGVGTAGLAAATVAAIGPATAAALAARGVTCAVVPEDYLAEGLLAALERDAVDVTGVRVLLPRAREARRVLPETLQARGALVDVLPIYDTEAADGLAVPVARIEAADYVTFTSSSTARRFAALLGEAVPARGAGRPLAERLAGARLCAIGPVTSATLREIGLPVAVEAGVYTVAGLVAAIAVDARRRAADGVAPSAPAS